MLTDLIRMTVFNRDKWHCRHCNNANGLDPHHVIYKSAGGKDVPNNLLVLCRKCHDDVHGGRLKIEVVIVLKNNLTVKFWKQKGWKP